MSMSLYFSCGVHNKLLFQNSQQKVLENIIFFVIAMDIMICVGLNVDNIIIIFL